MSARPARAAKSNGEVKRRGDVQDPDYGEDVFVEVYFNKDTGEYKWPGKPFKTDSSRKLGDDFYDVRHVMKDGTWDKDWTKGVHWNPDFAEGHGIWLVDFAPKDVTSKALGDVTSKDKETVKVTAK